MIVEMQMMVPFLEAAYERKQKLGKENKNWASKVLWSNSE